MTFFGFPKVNWLHPTSELYMPVTVHVKLSQESTHRKLLKSVNFLQSYSKNRKVGVLGHSVVFC